VSEVDIATLRLSGVVQADPHPLTLDAVGDYLYKSLGHTRHISSQP
jgi:hypothetical protein